MGKIIDFIIIIFGLCSILKGVNGTPEEYKFLTEISLGSFLVLLIAINNQRYN